MKKQATELAKVNQPVPKKYLKTGANPLEDQEICKALTFMTRHFGSLSDLSAIASFSGITKQNLCKRFQRRMGMSPMAWLWAFRCNLAMQLIKSTPQGCLETIAIKCGFKHQTHFSKKFKKFFDLKPSSFRGFCRKSKSIRSAVNQQTLCILPPVIQNAFRDTMEAVRKNIKECGTSYMDLFPKDENKDSSKTADIRRLFEKAFLRPVVSKPRRQAV